MSTRGLVMYACAAALVLLGGCSRSGSDSLRKEHVLVSVGDSVLALPDVVACIPVGLHEADSMAMFEAIVREWIQTRLLEHSVRGVDPASLEHIDHQARDYRRRMLLLQYIRNLEDVGDGEIPEHLVREYYDSHSRELQLDRPIAKGIFLRIDASSPERERVERWMSAADKSSVAKIEKYAIGDATGYEYFLDRWVDVLSLPEFAPLRISGALADIKAGGNYAARSGGMLYLLHISEKLDSGSRMPYDFAAPRIREVIRSGNRRESEAALMRTLVQRSSESGLLRGYDYDITKLINKKND